MSRIRLDFFRQSAWMVMSTTLGGVFFTAVHKLAKNMPKDEYGVFSFDGKRLPNYIAYVNNQKAHHANGQLLRILERTNELALPFVQENQAPYGHDDDWWPEMELLDKDDSQTL